MNSITVKGLIIKEVKVGEGNKIFTILTPDGLLQAGANGVRSYKSKLAAGCSLFGFSEFRLRQGKQIYSMQAADKIENFYAIREDIERLALATYICELLCETATTGQDSAGILQLALNTLYYIANSEDIRLAKPVFELRLMAESGLAPNLESCAKCGAEEGLAYFSIVDGGLVCKNCGEYGAISPAAVSAMRYILQAEPKKIFSFTVTDQVLEELSGITQRYILANIGRKPRSLEYLLSI